MAKVFLDYTQEELDRAYDQSAYAPNREQILSRIAHTSELARRRLGPAERFSYGETAIEGLDLYRAKAERAPICVFVHGGAWRAGLARDYAFPAETFMRAGAHYAALDFNNVLETLGDLMPMAEQVRRGIAWVCRNAERLGADARRVYVAGTSSGAHLAGVAATTDWTRYGLAADAIRGFTLASGMYDLRGPRLSKRAAYVRFTDEAEQALSPQRRLDAIRAPIVLLYGSLETPEFQRQTREFADALTRAGKSCELIRAEGYNHFELTETLGNPYGPLGRAVLSQMKLG